MSYEKATERSFNAGKHHLDLVRKWGVPWQVWDAPRPGEPEDNCGADNNMTLEKANALLAPFNMAVTEARRGTWWTLSVLDIEKPWPSNWSGIADSVVSGFEPPRGKFGRYKWPPEAVAA